MAEVKERLQARFPQADPTVVAAAIRVAASEITGPIREFVPLLVERAPRTRLDGALAGGTAVERAEDATSAVRRTQGDVAPNIE